jgi:hypothetical protein
VPLGGYDEAVDVGQLAHHRLHLDAYILDHQGDVAELVTGVRVAEVGVELVVLSIGPLVEAQVDVSVCG